jgi:hypothetical protein
MFVAQELSLTTRYSRKSREHRLGSRDNMAETVQPYDKSTTVEALTEKPSAKALVGEDHTPDGSSDVTVETIVPSDYVQAAVRTEDGEEPANTLRAWVLGFCFVTVSSGVNMLLSMRSPAITIPVVAILLLVYPVGCFWAWIVPARTFNTFGITWSSNPGRSTGTSSQVTLQP